MSQSSFYSETAFIKKSKPSKDQRTIVLVGLMGAGKTALGNKLARQMGRPFIDSDVEIERSTDMKIRDIFEYGGEAHFRDIEAQTIKAILEGPPVVLSSGGGAFCQPALRAIIKQKALSIWLDAPPETLFARIKNTASRPLLHGNDPLEVLKSLAEDRNPHYAEADVTLKTKGLGLARAVSDLVLLVNTATRKLDSADDTE
mgnify:CR=1 FL=1